MNTTERAYERLERPTRCRIRSATWQPLSMSMRPSAIWREVTMDTKTHERVATKPTPPRRRQWWIAVAAFVAVLAIGGALVLAPFGGSGPEPGPATTVTQPPTTTQASSTFEETVAVVETFWATWNSGDIEATVALLDPDITVPGSPATFRSFMEHLAPQGGTWVVTNCSELLGEGSFDVSPCI